MKDVTNPRDNASCNCIEQVIVKSAKRYMVEDGSPLSKKSIASQ